MQIENLLHKEQINNLCLKKCLYMKMKEINIFECLFRQGIEKVSIYGYGILGQFTVAEALNSNIKINYIIDKGNIAIQGVESKIRFSGDENEIVLVTVMTDVKNICDKLREQNCKNILILEDVLDEIMLTKKIPELFRFEKLEEKKSLQVVNFGTGMGFYDFVYDGLPIKAFNFSLPQQFLQMDYRLMEHYYSKMSKGCKVILTLPYCIFCAEMIEEAKSTYERYYAILPEDIVSEVSERSIDAYREHIRYMEFDFLDGKMEFSKPLDAEVMEKQSQEALENWIRQLSILSFASGELSTQIREGIEKNKKWLRRIIDFCKQKDFEPIIVIPPMSQVLLDKISMDFRESHFYEPLHEVVGDEIQILNYSDDKKFCNPNLYGWPGFLIHDAAKEFTRDVLSKIGINMEDTNVK